MKITVKGQEYTCEKISRTKYAKFRDTYQKITKDDPDKMIFTEEDLDDMVEVIVFVYDNAFTVDDINDDLDVPEIMFHFSLINAEVMNKVNLQTDVAKKNSILMDSLN
ncbi:MAG: hypothetical protein E7262_09700 [Lachnospiraceae bacterium]|nr:hypothetical protein [Lachnospiraceae bacterium]